MTEEGLFTKPASARLQDAVHDLSYGFRWHWYRCRCGFGTVDGGFFGFGIKRADELAR